MVKKLKKDKLESKRLFYFALGLFVISLVVFLVNVFQIKLTGYGTTGSVNITVGSISSINISTRDVNFSIGSVNAGEASATLDTALGTVTSGNWTANTAGLVVENIGNKNVSLNISSGKTAATFLNGTSPSYEYNFSNPEANSCVNDTGNATRQSATWITAATTQATICSPFLYADASDQVRIDVKLVVPSDAAVGALQDTITLTFWVPPGG